MFDSIGSKGATWGNSIVLERVVQRLLYYYS